MRAQIAPFDDGALNDKTSAQSEPSLRFYEDSQVRQPAFPSYTYSNYTCSNLDAPNAGGHYLDCGVKRLVWQQHAKVGCRHLQKIP